MSKPYVVAVDGSSHGWKALDTAVTLAKSTDAPIYVIHVVPTEPVPKGLEEWAEIEGVPRQELAAHYKNRQHLGDNILSEAKKMAEDAGNKDTSTAVKEGNVADCITKFVDEIDAAMVFIGSRGLGNIKSMLLGSVSQKVAHMAPCTCVIVK